VLLICEVLLVGGSFLLATTFLMGPDAYIVLIYESGLLKIAGITVLTLLLTYYFDLYEPRRISEDWEIYFRLLLVLSVLSFVLAGLVYFSRSWTLVLMSYPLVSPFCDSSRSLAAGSTSDHWPSHVPRAGLCSGLRQARNAPW